MNKEILIAGTRLTGTKMHLGTYYGWIYQIKRALKNYNVIVMISDYQSLDNDYDDNYYDVAITLKKYLKQFLPNVPIIIESDIENILKLGFLIQDNFKSRYYKRVMPIRKIIEENHSIYLHTLLYPSMMLADILALDATSMFNKPEGKFQHSEIINNMIHDLNVRYSFDFPKMKIFHKQSVNILSLDGTGPMKRNREENGIIEISNVDDKYIFNQLLSSNSECIRSILNSIDYIYEEDDIFNKEFLKRLSKKIYEDIIPVTEKPFMSEEEIIKNANDRVNGIIRGIEFDEKSIIS